MSRAKLIWFNIHLPPGLDLAAVTNVLRPLATRPKVGLTRHTPVVVFELRAIANKVGWLLGMEHRLRGTVPSQLQAQLVGLVLLEQKTPDRPTPLLASTVHTTGAVQRLRLEMAPNVSAGLLHVLHSLGSDESAAVQFVLGPAQRRKVKPEAFNLPASLGLWPSSKSSARDQNLWRQKASEPLFAVRCRVGASASQPERAVTITRALTDALSLASASHTALRARQPTTREARGLAAVYTRGNHWSAMLSAAELATLLGWPLDGVVSSGLGRHFNPAPPSLLLPERQVNRPSKLRVLGASLHPADADRLVTMPVSGSLHHVHVTGVTGSGKSTLLAQLVRADIAAGRSVLVIEPRGDLVADILAGVPEHRRDDVVVIEPGQAGLVVGINPLAGTRQDAERRADRLLHLFREVFGSSVGARSSDVLLHCLIALARKTDGTLADVPVLLTNGRFRRQVLSEVNDPLVLAPFFAQYDALSDDARSQVIAPVLNKTRAFLSRSSIRRLLGQASPRFQLDELFTKRRIVLVNLNSGIIGEETASLIGAIFAGQLWPAIQRRAAVPKVKRWPVMVVIDEVQNYLKMDVGEMLAQARGLGVSLTLAHQHLGQLSSSLQAAFLANARSKIALKPSTGDVGALVKAMGSVNSAAAGARQRGNGNGLTTEDLEGLGRFEACARLLVDGVMSSAFGVKTLPLGAALSEPNELRRLSQERYGVDGDVLDSALTKRWHGGSGKNKKAVSDGQIGVMEEAV